MKFTRPERASNTYSNNPESIDGELPHNSLLRFSRKSQGYLYTRYPIVVRALGRVRARAKVSCIQQGYWKRSIIPDVAVTTKRYSITLRLVCKIPLLARRTRPMQPVGQARRATIGYIVYNTPACQAPLHKFLANNLGLLYRATAIWNQ